jgi:hypothetical protein
MLEVISLLGSCAIVERCRHEFKKNFLCFLGNYPKLVMHVQSILEMVAFCLHLLENSYMHNKPVTNLFMTFNIFFHVSQQRLGCVPLQEAPTVAIVFWQSQSYLSF